MLAREKKQLRSQHTSPISRRGQGEKQRQQREKPEQASKPTRQQVSGAPSPSPRMVSGSTTENKKKESEDIERANNTHVERPSSKSTRAAERLLKLRTHATSAVLAAHLCQFCYALVLSSAYAPRLTPSYETPDAYYIRLSCCALSFTTFVLLSLFLCAPYLGDHRKRMPPPTCKERQRGGDGRGRGETTHNMCRLHATATPETLKQKRSCETQDFTATCTRR